LLNTEINDRNYAVVYISYSDIFATWTQENHKNIEISFHALRSRRCCLFSLSCLRDTLACAYHRLVIMRVYARYIRGRRNNVRKIDILFDNIVFW